MPSITLSRERSTESLGENSVEGVLFREMSGSACCGISNRVSHKAHVQQVLDLWLLREQARVQAAERQFLARLQAVLERARQNASGVNTGHMPHLNNPVQRADSAWIRDNSGPAPLRSPEHELVGRERSWQAPLAEQHNVTNVLDSQFRHQLERVLVERQSDLRSGMVALPYYRRLHRLNNPYLPRNRDSEGRERLVDDTEEEEGMYEDDAEVDSFELDQTSGSAIQKRRGEGRDDEILQAIQSLQQEVQILKNVINASFDVQLDVQRAIRQEVAAGLNTNLTSRQINHSERRRGNCVICCEAATNCVLYACGHMCACAGCARSLLSTGHSCPMCRAPVRDVVVVYEADDTVHSSNSSRN